MGGVFISDGLGSGDSRNRKATDLWDDSARGDIVIQTLPNVQQSTIQPIIESTVSPGTLIYTDEYDIYSRL
jgi:hypothetical protein